MGEFKQELVSPAGIYARFYRKGLLDYQGRPALFIDRDGVLIEEVGYLTLQKNSFEIVFVKNLFEIPSILINRMAESL